MNIELMKKLEDSKIILRKLNSKLSECIDIKKNQYIQSAREDFSNFFTNKGFNVQSENLSVIASYGNLKASLSHKEPKTNLVGCYFAFTLNLEKLNDKEYLILLNKSKPSTKIRFSPLSGPDSNSIQKEIDSVQHDIDITQARLNGFPEEKWYFFIKNDGLANKHICDDVYPSMYELLSSLIK